MRLVTLGMRPVEFVFLVSAEPAQQGMYQDVPCQLLYSPRAGRLLPFLHFIQSKTQKSAYAEQEDKGRIAWPKCLGRPRLLKECQLCQRALPRHRPAAPHSWGRQKLRRPVSHLSFVFDPPFLSISPCGLCCPANVRDPDSRKTSADATCRADDGMHRQACASYPG